MFDLVCWLHDSCLKGGCYAAFLCDRDFIRIYYCIKNILRVKMRIQNLFILKRLENTKSSYNTANIVTLSYMSNKSPYFLIYHLKMGLIRSGYTKLTPENYCLSKFVRIININFMSRIINRVEFSF